MNGWIYIDLFTGSDPESNAIMKTEKNTNDMKRFFYFFILIIVSQAIFVSCRDKNDELTEEKGPVNIFFETQRVVVENPYEGKGITITANGADVVVHSKMLNEVTYVLSGSTADGSLKIYSDTKFELKMSGVCIINNDDPALNIQSGKKATITLVNGTLNTLIGGTMFATEDGDEDVKAAFFSEGQLVFSGAGNLEVEGRYRHAICSDDYIRIDGGHITVLQSEKDGLHANDYVEINGGELVITSASDGIESEGYVTISGGLVNIVTTGQKGHGIKSAAATTIDATGDVNIRVEGVASKAFKCGEDMLISRGNITLATYGNAFYDAEESGISSAAGIKCDGDFTIKGGHLLIESSGSGGKGINVVGNITLEGGNVSVRTGGEPFVYRDDNSAAKAIKCDGRMTIGDCSVMARTSGRKAEGLESESDILITNGVVEVEAYDDGIKAAKSITVNGGFVYSLSETKGAVFSKGTFSITGGTVLAVGCAASESGVDCNGLFKITGGTLVGLGSEMSLPASDVSTQYSLVYTSANNIIKNSFINLTSSEGKNIMTYLLPCSLSPAKILFSSPGLMNGVDYTISSGGFVTGGTSSYDLYTGADYTGGSSLSSFAVSSMVTILAGQ